MCSSCGMRSRDSMAVVAIPAAIIRLIYGDAFVRLVSLCRFAYLADAVVSVCFSSELVPCRSMPGAMALRSHGEQDQRAETIAR